MPHHENQHPYIYYKRLSAKKMAEEALKQKLWFYDKGVKAWLTPEEFLQYYEMGEYNDDHLSRVSMRSPLDALETGYKQIRATHVKLEAFTKRVLDYYHKKIPVPKIPNE